MRNIITLSLTLTNIILLLFLFIVPSPRSQLLQSNYSEIYSKALFNETNQELPREWDDCLAQKAEERARRMREKEFFSHDGWIEKFLECGEYIYAGENLSIDYPTAEEAHYALMESPLHKKNIMNEHFERMGIGCYEGLCVEFFKN